MKQLFLTLVVLISPTVLAAEVNGECITNKLGPNSIKVSPHQNMDMWFENLGPSDIIVTSVPKGSLHETLKPRPHGQGLSLKAIYKIGYVFKVGNDGGKATLRYCLKAHCSC